MQLMSESCFLAEENYEKKGLCNHNLRFFEGGDHSLSEHKKERDRLVLNWFNDYLKNERPLPNLKLHGR